MDDHAYVEGTTAAALIPHPRGQPDPSLVLDVLNQVAEALDYAHRMDVLRRDVKPTNVRIGRTTEISAVLTDFGISRFLDDTRPVSQNGRIAGSFTRESPFVTFFSKIGAPAFTGVMNRNGVPSVVSRSPGLWLFSESC